MRRIFIFITLILSAASQVVFAQVAASPVLRAYATSETVYINKLSDNGLWAVASNVDANNSTLENYPYLFNVQTGSVLSLLSEDEKLSSPDCGARDVTDDGKLIVGSYQGMENYYDRLQTYVQALGLSDVIFTGHIKFAEILAYYRAANVFLCMSEHEGFCVPLVEAMHFQVPVIAYDTSAIADTLGGSGSLLQSNDPLEAAMVIDRLVTDEELQKQVIAGQNRRLADFQYEKVRELFISQLRSFIGGGDK